MWFIYHSLSQEGMSQEGSKGVKFPAGVYHVFIHEKKLMTLSAI